MLKKLFSITAMILFSASYSHASFLDDNKLNYELEDKAINEIWKNYLTKEQRKAILPEQRKWIKSKDKCGDPAKLKDPNQLNDSYKCLAEMTFNRSIELISSAKNPAYSDLSADTIQRIIIAKDVYEKLKNSFLTKNSELLLSQLIYPQDLCINNTLFRAQNKEDVKQLFPNLDFFSIANAETYDQSIKYFKTHDWGEIVGWRDPFIEGFGNYSQYGARIEKETENCIPYINLNFCEEPQYNEEIISNFNLTFSPFDVVSDAPLSSNSYKLEFDAANNEYNIYENNQKLNLKRLQFSLYRFPIYQDENGNLYGLIGVGSPDDVCQGSGCFNNISKIVMFKKTNNSNKCSKVEFEF